eukprot:scaffold63514_cov56-Cyclotella_meneghiniana.AAC.1
MIRNPRTSVPSPDASLRKLTCPCLLSGWSAVGVNQRPEPPPRSSIANCYLETSELGKVSLSPQAVITSTNCMWDFVVKSRLRLPQLLKMVSKKYCLITN